MLNSHIIYWEPHYSWKLITKWSLLSCLITSSKFLLVETAIFSNFCFFPQNVEMEGTLSKIWKPNYQCSFEFGWLLLKVQDAHVSSFIYSLLFLADCLETGISPKMPIWKSFPSLLSTTGSFQCLYHHNKKELIS